MYFLNVIECKTKVITELEGNKTKVEGQKNKLEIIMDVVEDLNEKDLHLGRSNYDGASIFTTTIVENSGVILKYQVSQPKEFELIESEFY